MLRVLSCPHFFIHYTINPDSFKLKNRRREGGRLRGEKRAPLAVQGDEREGEGWQNGFLRTHEGA
jgi:hypothetical protein